MFNSIRSGIIHRYHLVTTNKLFYLFIGISNVHVALGIAWCCFSPLLPSQQKESSRAEIQPPDTCALFGACDGEQRYRWLYKCYSESQRGHSMGGSKPGAPL